MYIHIIRDEERDDILMIIMICNNMSIIIIIMKNANSSACLLETERKPSATCAAGVGSSASLYVLNSAGLLT